ncbi:hypothetical protein LPJ59_002129 [Coemansia sp. RSA 2399]|nr:hypothetical protein LPJ59_002129 [Coemansia sp. RSA 2399]KAJ1905538.1 hypothetical protein LPJ81_001869 [Coemansia sp. IMI 209127]
MDKLLLAARSNPFSSDEERVQYLETLLNMHVDPVGSADTAVIAVGSALFGITFLFIATAWLRREFRPIRAKNLPMVTTLFITGLLWFVGDIPTNGHVLLNGVFSNCKEWNAWVHVLFSFWYTTVLVIRCFALDRVFNQNKPTRGIAYYAPSAILILFYLGYSIATQVMPDKLTVGYNSDLGICVMTNGYQYVTVGVMWVNWLVFIIMMVRLRNIPQSFNEIYESLLICALGVAGMVKTSVIHFTQPAYPLILGYRVAETIGDVIICNGVILVIIGYPVIRSLVRSEEYESKWIMRLRTDGLEDAYATSITTHINGTLSFRPMSGKRPFSADARANDGLDNKSQYVRMNDYDSGKASTAVVLSSGPFVAHENMHAVTRSRGVDIDDPSQTHIDRRSQESVQFADDGTWSRRIL